MSKSAVVFGGFYLFFFTEKVLRVLLKQKNGVSTRMMSNLPYIVLLVVTGGGKLANYNGSNKHIHKVHTVCSSKMCQLHKGSTMIYMEVVKAGGS